MFGLPLTHWFGRFGRRLNGESKLRRAIWQPPEALGCLLRIILSSPIRATRNEF